MIYEHMIKGTFLNRPNRFIAFVKLEDTAENKGETVICHVKNTGRCKELLIAGVTVLIQFHPEAALMGRKTEYSLIGVFKERTDGPLLINMDSQAPNKAAYEWLQSVAKKYSIKNIRREVSYDKSRFDLAFQISKADTSLKGLQEFPAFMEVKGVTLEENGTALFPDAPTQRGVKHMKELIRARKEGYEAYLLFVIQMKGMTLFKPNEKTHEAFARTLEEAKNAGVHILAYDCLITENSMTIDQPVPVLIGT